jgi:glycosyltransferase involved in cell wall biosynthesis
MSGPRIAVLIPCFNEQIALPAVIAGFRAALPDAAIHAYDNNSTDDTVAVARASGAIVGRETRQGKGQVVRRMFADVEADVFVLVDGDATYDAASAPAMVDLLLSQGLDMVTGVRVSDAAAAYRPGHRAGNSLLSGLVSYLFGAPVGDMLSGYRVFSRRFVKSFPALSAGFETETEFTVHALQLALPVGELPTPYKQRPAGSASKLRTVKDGLRILQLILLLVKDERPLPFFSLCGAGLFLIGLVLGGSVVAEFWRTGLVPRLPTAIVAAALVALSFLSLACGLILDSVGRGRREMKRLFYLSLNAPSEAAGK